MARDSFYDGMQSVKILISDGGEIFATASEENLKSGGLTIDRYTSSAAAVELGTTIAAECSVRLDNSSGEFDGLKRGFTLDVSIFNEDMSVEQPLGHFVILSVTKYQSEITISALDSMVYLDEQANISVPQGATIRSLIQQMCEDCGVTADIETIPEVPIKGYKATELKTYRTLIGHLAELAGAVAYMTIENKLAFGWYVDKGLEINSDVRFSSDLSDTPLVIENVSITDTALSGVAIKDDKITLNIVNNPFVYGMTDTEKKDLEENIRNGVALNGMPLYNASATILPIPDLMPLEIVMWNGEKPVAITRTTFTSNQNMHIEGVADGTSDYSNEMGLSLASAKSMATDAQDKADEAKTAADEAKTAADTAKESADNANSAVTALNQSLDQEEIFNRLTNNGEAEGIYLENGNLYINGTYIKSGVIDAGLIKAGILTDDQGKNYWNMKTGEFSLTSAIIDGYATDSELTQLTNTINAEIADLQEQLDGKIETWYYNYAPTLTNEPASNWTTDAEKENHIGDLFYDLDTGYAYRFVLNNGVYSWQQIADTDTAEALALAREAQETASEKRRVFITQPTPPYDKGDLWMQGASGDILVCTTAKAEDKAYAASDWSKLNKYIDQATVNSSISTYDTSLNQSAVFNKLTNNGQTQGIYLQDGKLYINGTYISTGLITDKQGKNYWNLDTGEFSLTGYATDDDVSAVETKANNAQSTANTALSQSVEYIVGTHTAATSSWTGKTVDASIKAGKTIAYYLPYTGVSGTGSTLNLTLSGGGTTGAKNVLMNTTAVTTHYPAGTVIKMTFDGTSWKTDNYNSDTINRTRYQANLKAAAAITAGRIVCGTSSGYRNIAANVSFDLTYPLLYAATTIAAGATSGTLDNNFLEINGINFSNNGTITSGAASKTIYLKGTVSGNTFTISASPFLTTVPPTTADGLYYIPLGLMTSATVGYFSSSNRLFAYLNGAFQAVDTAAKLLADKAQASANAASSAVTALNTALNQQEIFNRLTNNGAAQGIFLQDGKLYVNGEYIQTDTLKASQIISGILTDKKGSNYWNLDTGEFVLGGYVTDDDLTDAISDINIGGRNYFLKSDDTSKWQSYTPTGYQVARINLSENLVKGDKYTITLWGTKPTRSDKTDTYYAIYWGGGSVSLGNVRIGTNGKGTLTFTVPNSTNTTTNNKWLCIYNTPMQGASGTTYSASLTKVKIELGTTATDWTPAPEDYDSELANFATSVTADIADLQDQIDGNITTWYYSYVPTLSNAPASTWTTTDLKNNHIGDLFYNSSTGYAYRFMLDGSTYKWVRISDTDITEALSKAQAAQDTADKKRRVFINQPTVPYDVGDLWYASASSEVKVCTTARATGSYTASDWVKRDKYTDDTTANAAQTTANTALKRSTYHYGTCGTAAATAAKAVTLANFELYTGAQVYVYFTYANTAASPTLNVNSTGAKPIWAKGAVLATGSPYNWTAKSLVGFTYNGSQWVMTAEDQTETFNRLTNGGTAEGIYLQNGKLYINGTYIASGVIDANLVKTGILADKSGKNYINMETGEISISGYASDSELSAVDTKAGNAQTAADNAQTTANNANTAASNAQSTANQGKLIGTCGTAAATAAKVVTCTDCTSLYTGLRITVTFTNANTSSAAVTLNVNSLGAKTIYVSGAVTSATNQILWGAGAQIQFVYDGTYFVPVGYQTTLQGSCTIAAGTAAKTMAYAKAVIARGTVASVYFSNANTVASPTLNIQSTGAKAIWAEGAAITATSKYNWTAKSTVVLTFDGAEWVIGEDTAAVKDAATAQTTANNATTAASNAQTTANTALSQSVEYIKGTQTEATNVWTGASTDSSIKAGKNIAYYLPYAGTSTAATLNLTLSGGGTTGAKNVRINNSNVTTHYPAGTVIKMTYDGTYWKTDNYNSDTINRTKFDANLIAASTITAGRLICGTSSGYRNIAANISFDLSYPLLYAATSIASGATTGTLNNNFLEINGITYSNNGTITSGAAGKTLYLKGTVSGNTFTIAASPFLTTVQATSADGYYYIPLGLMTSATVGYFNSSNRLYAYLNGAFQAVDTAAKGLADAAQTTANTANSTANTANTRATYHYGTCSTAIGTAAKVVTLANFSLYTGAEITVKFTNGNTAAAPTLNVNSTGAKAVIVNNATTALTGKMDFPANTTATFTYNGTQWQLTGSDNLLNEMQWTSGSGLTVRASSGANSRVNITNNAVNIYDKDGNLGNSTTANGMDIYKGGTKVSSFGDIVTVGASGTRSYFEIREKKISAYNLGGYQYFATGDLMGSSVRYRFGRLLIAETNTFPISYPESRPTVKVGDGDYSTATSITDFTYTNTLLTINANITEVPRQQLVYVYIEYVPSQASPYFIFGTRKESSSVGQLSSSFGTRVEASGLYSFGEGYYTTASGGFGSHAEGYSTTASGQTSHAEGSSTTASGHNSHAEGRGTIAKGDYQHVQGKYNVSDTGNTYAHIVGAGTSSARKNIHTLDWSGNAWFAGNVQYAAGDTVTLSTGTLLHGYVASQGAIRFFIPLPKSPSGRTCTISTKPSKINIYGIQGLVNGASNLDLTASQYTWAASAANTGVTLTVGSQVQSYYYTKVTLNTPVTAYLGANMVITFS